MDFRPKIFYIGISRRKHRFGGWVITHETDTNKNIYKIVYRKGTEELFSEKPDLSRCIQRNGYVKRIRARGF